MKKPSATARILTALAALLGAGGVALLGWALYGRDDAGTAPREAVPVFYKDENTEYRLENEELLFVLDGDTTQFTVLNKMDGHTWRSTPENAASDPLALAGKKNLLQSTLALTYSTNRGVRTLYDSFEYSIRNKVYEIQADERQVKVSYTLGRIQRAYFIPNVITQARMDGFLAALTKAQARKILDSYRKHDPSKLQGKQLDDLLLQYPVLQQGTIYVLRDNVKDFLKGEFEGLFRQAGYTYDDYLMDQTGSGASLGSQDAVFNLCVIYTLEGPDLVVRVPMDEIAYMEEFPPVGLNLLPNFGAGGVSDEGFIIVPEGGGGIIRFNNGKTTQNSYFANMYGWDYATWREAVVHETNARLPVFGMVSNGSAFLCMQEELASVSSITADVSGKGNSYNTVSASYALLHYDAFNVTDRTIETVYMYEAGLPEGAIVQRYRFIPAGDYVPLAKAYREYLIRRYPGLGKAVEAKVPVSVEIAGAIDKVQQKGGLPVSEPVRLTGYREAAEIAGTVAGWGGNNVYVRLSGWMNGGVRQRVLNGVSLVGCLGSAADFSKMAEDMRKSGVKLCLNGITGFALDSGLPEGFVGLRDAARFTTREQVKLYQYSNIWYGMMDYREPYFLLSPQVAGTMAGNLIREAKARGAYAVAFEDLGRLLSADYNPARTVTREESMRMQVQAMAAARNEGLGLVVRGGNIYTLEYADLVTDADLEGVPYAIFDSQVPFVQIALHGLVQYTGKPLNLDNDWEQELLVSAQRGAGLSFLFMKEEPEILHDTDYARYFGASFDLWAGRAETVLREYESKLGGTFDQAITDFRQFPGGLSLTTYEDGTRVAVNFSREDALLEGLAVPARSYEVIKGGGK